MVTLYHLTQSCGPLEHILFLARFSACKCNKTSSVTAHITKPEKRGSCKCLGCPPGREELALSTAETKGRKRDGPRYRSLGRSLLSESSTAHLKYTGMAEVQDENDCKTFKNEIPTILLGRLSAAVRPVCHQNFRHEILPTCLLYTSDAADE